MLYLVGIGLCNEKDITLKGLEAVKKCDIVYLEGYTSVLCNAKKENLERFYRKKIIIADREFVEEGTEILDNAKKSNVALLVIGDVCFATTHISLYLEAIKRKIKCKIIHNASVINAIGDIGLELYKFGRITSIPIHAKDVESPYNILYENKKAGAHTLILLDLEPKLGRFITIGEAVSYLLSIEEKRKENVFTKQTKCIAGIKLGCENKVVKYGMAKEFLTIKFNGFPQCLIVPSNNLHFVEEEALERFRV